MALPTSRQQHIDYCLRNLGAPVLQINADPEQLEDRVDEALQYYRDYHFDGTALTSYTLTPPAAVTGAVAGSAGSIKITDSNGTATYTSGSGTHVVA